MLPYNDQNPTRRMPIVTYALIGLMVLTFCYLLLIGPRRENFVAAWGVAPTDIAMLLNGNIASLGTTFLTMLMSVFMHGGWLHLITNALFLWVFGDNVEDNFGHGGYLLFFLACGMAGLVGQTFVTPRLPEPMIGASGAVAGVLIAYLMMYPYAPVNALLLVVPVQIPAWMLGIVWLALQGLNGSFRIVNEGLLSGLRAFGFLLGGALVGICLTLMLRREISVPRYARRATGYVRRRRRE